VRSQFTLRTKKEKTEENLRTFITEEEEE